MAADRKITCKVVSVVWHQDDQDSSTYELCAETEKGRVHLTFGWSAYDGDVFKHTFGPRARLSPCICSAKPRPVPSWLPDIVDRYQRDFPGKKVEIQYRPPSADQPVAKSLLDLPWEEIE